MRIHDQPKDKIVVFDMDNTLLKSRFIDQCANAFNFVQALSLLRQIDKDPVSLTRRIASFLNGRKKTELVDIADSIPIVPDVADVVHELKKRSYYIGIITDSYHTVAEVVSRKINADFVLANELQFVDGTATGEVLIPSFFHYSVDSECKHQVCKANALRHVCRANDIKLKDCIAVGDDENDICMLKHAGKGVSFCTKSELLKKVADRHIEEDSLYELLSLAL